MITVPVLRVLLKLDMSTTTVHSVPPHELALMTIRHGKGQVTEKGIVGTRDIDLEEDYKRLERRHGRDKETKRTWVDVAFGRYEEGRFEQTVMRGVEHYQLPATQDDEEELSPQQKAARTRKASKAKQAEDANGEDIKSAA